MGLSVIQGGSHGLVIRKEEERAFLKTREVYARRGMSGMHVEEVSQPD